MAAQGHDFNAIWQQIEELVVHSLLSVQPLLQLNYRTAFPATDSGFSCFELLGYDVLLDDKCRPWLLEVLMLPSVTKTSVESCMTVISSHTHQTDAWM